MTWCDLPVNDLLAAVLIEARAVRVSLQPLFKLTSGKYSPVYFDCRQLISHPAAMTIVAGAFQWFVERSGARVDVIAGGESAGIPFADRLAAVAGKPLVYVRKQQREHGTSAAIEGATAPGGHVLLIEDLITDGASKMSFVHGLRNAGMIVEHCLVVLDREQGGAEVLGAAGVTLHSLATAANVLDFGRRSGRLRPEDVDTALEYLSAPDAWSPPSAATRIS